VLITSGADIVSEAFSDKHYMRQWKMWALPEDLAVLVPSTVLATALEVGYVQTLLEQCGVRRDVASRWPQALGYRIVLRLAERGRIAFAIVSGRQDLRRVGRKRARRYDAVARRVGSQQILRALTTGGSRLARLTGEQR
jgi:hypothetical protein